LLLLSILVSTPALAAEYRVAAFEADVTIPLGHACMGGGIADAKEIDDPLFAKGFVLLGAGEPIVLVALDWCQCNNDSYDRWRDVLAEAAGTVRRRVMLATVHQHDAPICDLTAQKLLDQYGLRGYNCDPVFHEKAVQRTAAALRKALESPRRVTHFGLGQAKVERVASNRRVVTPEGKIHWGRGSASGDVYGAPEGEIDPYVKTISLFDGGRPVLAVSCYAVHPMSYYGRGGVSADFPGIARARRQKDDPGVFQVYFTGCAGDTTAGKYNTGTPENRLALADRLYQGMLAAWKAAERFPLDKIDFRVADLPLPARDGGDFTVDAMKRILADPKETRWRRISAALGLSWRQRVDAGQPVDVPCLDLGGQAQFLIMPAESFVGYQLAAQRLRPDSFVGVAGFGDGAGGYIPTDQCWRDGYDDSYCWVPRMTEKLMTEAMARALGPTPKAGAASRWDGAWGKTVAGLRCAIGLKRPVVRVGDPIEVEIGLQNVSGEKLTFYYPPDYRAQLLEIRNKKGEPVRKEMTATTEGWMHNKPYVTLQPDEVFSASFLGKTAFRVPRPRAAERSPCVLAIEFHPDAMRYELVEPGTFTVALHLAAEEKAAAQAAKRGVAALWQGDLSSEVLTFQVQAATRDELDAARRDLREGAPQKQQQAIHLLGAHVDGKAVPALVEILLDGPPQARRSAGAALAAIKDPAIVPDLLARYRRATSAELRRSLLEIIESSGDATRNWPLHLETADAAVSWDEKHQAISRLVDLRRPEVVPILVRLARNGDPIAQRAAIDLIGTVLEVGAPKFAQEVLTQLTGEMLDVLKNDADATVRSRAAGALRHARGPAVVPALIEALKDPDPWVGSYAAHTLGRIAGAEAIPGLEEYLARASQPGQKDAARAALDAIRRGAKP